MPIRDRPADAGGEDYEAVDDVKAAMKGLLAPVDKEVAMGTVEVRELFRRTVPLGLDHGTVGVLGQDDSMYEVTTFRLDVETGGRHHHPGKRLVATGDRDHGIEALCVHHQLNRVGDDLSGHQRGAHSLVAH